MEINAKVRLLLEPKSGISQSTGNGWMSQDVVFDYFWWANQQQPSQIVMRVFGEDRIKQWNLQPNDEVNIRYHAEAHEYNGRWFNELRIDNITFIGASVTKNPQYAQQQDAAEQTQQAPQATAETKQEGAEDDDLPF